MEKAAREAEKRALAKEAMRDSEDGGAVIAAHEVTTQKKLNGNRPGRGNPRKRKLLRLDGYGG